MKKGINSASATKGFTIIELLVVVAIIAVLTGIVLVNVTPYINKGKDAAIKANLNTILINGAVYYDDNSNYNDFETSNGYTVPAAAAVTANGGTDLTYSSTNNDHFCVCSITKAVATDTLCVDDSGYKKITNGSCSERCTDTQTPGYNSLCVD
ncbi:MAG: type II secretion system protein [Candidatus Staskawiczbacteria bacterium]|nr:type II secretion system protein [Candidatus Staskawiczbacteria bacterium]